MIRRVCLEHFRAFKHKCVSLERQTVIHGPPNSGKTTVMETVALLMQSRGEYWLALEGPHLIVHEPEDLHYGGNLEIPFAVELGIELDIGSVNYGYKYAAGTGYVEQWVGLNGETLIRVKREGTGASSRTRCTQDSARRHTPL
jgi:energy-coupling factor transporter ATP-binding protein EcfA2